MACFALALDTDHACELHLFKTDAERENFMWDYAFANADTETTTVDGFKLEYGGDISQAMAATNDGWHTDDMEDDPAPVIVAADPDLLAALVKINDRLTGKWYDPTGDLESDLLGVVRPAIAKAEAVKTVAALMANADVQNALSFAAILKTLADKAAELKAERAAQPQEDAADRESEIEAHLVMKFAGLI